MIWEVNEKNLLFVNENFGKSWATFFASDHPVGVGVPSPIVKGSRKRRKSLKPKKQVFFHTRPFEWFFFCNSPSGAKTGRHQ